MVRINDNVYTVVKKFNNDVNMIKKTIKWDTSVSKNMLKFVCK